MPRLIHIAGNVLLTLGVPDDKAVPPAVFRNPFSLRRVGKRLAQRIQVECKSGLMLRMTRARRIPVRRLFSVPADVVVIERLLIAVDPVARADKNIESLFFGGFI